MDSFLAVSIAVAAIALTSAGGLVALVTMATRANRATPGDGEG